MCISKFHEKTNVYNLSVFVMLLFKLLLLLQEIKNQILKAVKNGDVKTLQDLLEQHPDYVNVHDDHDDYVS